MQKLLISTCAFFLTAVGAHAVTLAASGSPVATDPSLRAWFDASDAATLWQDTAGTIAAANGAPIARWDSKATSTSISTQQANAANTPSFSSTVASLNNTPAVSFIGGGGGDALTSTTGNSTGITGTNAAMTMISIFQRTGTTSQNYQHALHLGNTVGNQAYGHSVSRGGNNGQISNHYWGSGHDFFASTADNTGYLVLSTYDGVGNTDTYYLDGTAAPAHTYDVNIGGDQLHLGSRLNPFTEGFTGDLAEVIIYDTIVSNMERNALGFYVQNKYGITIDGAAPIPEPSGTAILGLFGLWLLGARRRRTA